MIKCDGAVFSSGKGAKRVWHAEARRISGRSRPREGFHTGPHPSCIGALRAGNRAIRGLGWTLAEPWARCK